MTNNNKNRIGYKSVIDLGREAKVEFPHNIGEYPTKILPQVMGEFIERFSNIGDLVVDPFCGSGTVAVECAIRNRRSICSDINPIAINVSMQKLEALFKQADMYQKFNKGQELLIADARNLPLKSRIADLVITDIPYADMIKYSNLENDLSNIEDYDVFLEELRKSFLEIKRILKENKYAIVFCTDYRIARSRLILPLHVDVINIMIDLEFTLFDLYIWRYYRSGGFRPFGKKPFQAMNIHSYILVFCNETKRPIIKNRPIRYRNRLIEKVEIVNNQVYQLFQNQCLDDL